MEGLDEDAVRDMLLASGIKESYIEDLCEFDGEPHVKSPGKFFHFTTLTRDKADHFFQSERAVLKLAFHGTSIAAAKTILAEGLKPGPYTITERPMIYCEGCHRASSCFQYATHTACPTLLKYPGVPGTNPAWMWSAFFELLVDRNGGRTKHKQWVQYPDSVRIVGVHIHVFNMLDAFNKGCSGWFRVHKRELAQL